MKDYYQTLGIPENAGDEDIRKAFRKLAFQYHPDKNIGHEKAAEEKFKDINEAYVILSDKVKRQQYDAARQGGMAGAAFGNQSGFHYSQQDIFREAFNNRNSVDDLNRMFAQAGLRFDQDFLNRVFFSANNVVFRVYTYPTSGAQPVYRSTSGVVQDEKPVESSIDKPGFLERWAARTTLKLSKFVLKRLFGVQMPDPSQNLDVVEDFEIDPAEAAGGEKIYFLRRGLKTKRLMIKIPAGIQNGTKIRLQGLGRQKNRQRGDLYLKVRLM